MTTPYDAIVLAGGAARRLDGADKPQLTVGGRPLLDRVLAACAGARSIVVVGPPRPAARPGPVPHWTREQPPGGGPVAAVAAALAEPAISAERVLLLAADLPFLDAATLGQLLSAVTGEVEAAVLVDADGRDQPLVAAYRTAALRTALAALGDPVGAPLRRLTAGLRTARVADRDGVSYDCDTWAELAEARRRAPERGGLTAPDSAV
ncbi:molybdopterin-guanine dinucleotide biosynthesis protein A [Kitasatospora sp. MAP12-15]|nr:molybdopterin-guanine dinucleotide biosynthesis protein A [Kitasatospora sp. MAP12-44]